MLQFYLLSFPAFPQEKATHFKGEIQLSIDNDAFHFPARDRYYSSGFRLTKRTLLKKESGLFNFLQDKLRKPLGEINKTTLEITMGHNFYTNRRIGDENVRIFDRPYAGWLFGILNFNHFLKRKGILGTQIDFGVVGPWAYGKEIQLSWHTHLGLKLPRGWKYQINNTPAVNVKFSYFKPLLSTGFFDFSSESSAKFGTILNNIRQGGVIRFLNFNSWNNTIYTRSKLGNGLSPQNISRYDQILEFYFFGGATIEYVIYNALIEGNFIGKESVHTEEAENFVIHYKFGLTVGGVQADFTLAMNRITAETRQGLNHGWASIDFNFRF